MKPVLVRNWLVLLVWPGAAVRLALRSNTWVCVVAGTMALALCFGLVASGASIGGLEPFRDLSHYFMTAMGLGGAAAFLALGVLAIIALVFVAPVMGVLAANEQRMKRVVPWARLRAAFLVPVSFLVPALAWGVCAMLAHTKDPGFSFTYITTPAWTASPFFDVCSSDVWLWLGGAAMCASAVLVAVRVGEFVHETDEVRCGQCGYSLDGLGNAPCPECGSERGSAP